MALDLIPHGAPAADAASACGRRRGLATVIGHGHAEPPAVPAPAGITQARGRVESAGTWKSDAVKDALAALLGPHFAPALRPMFEWHLCCGAFFHNDAHFDNVLFGVWAVAGPAAELVFPRAGVRVSATRGHAVVFDPFEVHGVLAPDRDRYCAEDYAAATPSVFIGFELELSRPVLDAFRIAAPSGGRALSSRTRIAAATGAFD